MAGPETLSDKPKPDAAKTSASADDAAKYVGTPAVGTSKAAAAAGVATVGPKDDQVNNRRRRLVYRIPPLLLAAHSFRASHRLQNRLSIRLRARRRHQVAAEISHLGRPHSRSRFCHLRALHPSRLHAGLEIQRKQIQVPLSRQRL